MEDYPLVNEEYGRFFSEHKPARVAVAVAGLPLDGKHLKNQLKNLCLMPIAQVEIDAIALITGA